MAATALRTLLILLAIWRGGAICTSFSYSAFPSTTVFGGQGYPNLNDVVQCQRQCNSVNNCYGYIFETFPGSGGIRCFLIFFPIDALVPVQSSTTLYIRDCPPPTPTRPPFPTTSTRRPPPPTRPPPPSTASSPCPPVDGLSTGLVVLIAVFTAIGGIILGMLMAVKCCPLGHGRNLFNVGDCPPDCPCPKCKPAPASHSCKQSVCNSCHKPGPVFPALPPLTGGVTPGQTFSVAASPYNDVYTVSLSGK